MGSRSNNNPFEGRYSASVGVSLKWTLFDGLARERRLSQSRWDKLAVEEDHRQISYLTKQNVLNSFYELEQGCQTYIASKLGVKLAQEAMEQASHQRTWGVISPLEYREAASLLTKSKRDFAKSSYELMMAYYRLVYNTGEDVASDYVEIEKTLQQAQD
jgi:outer membrane protein TolC